MKQHRGEVSSVVSGTSCFFFCSVLSDLSFSTDFIGSGSVNDSVGQADLSADFGFLEECQGLCHAELGADHLEGAEKQQYSDSD